MSDYETIRLCGGPADGRMMEWDGGDYVAVTTTPDVRFHPGADERYKELFVEHHTYRRSGPRSTTFIYQGNH